LKRLPTVEWSRYFERFGRFSRTATPRRTRRRTPQAATEGGPPGTAEFVHECPGCGEVYLSETPHRCSSCVETTAAVATDDD
jgi:hypothetical protein